MTPPRRARAVPLRGLRGVVVLVLLGLAVVAGALVALAFPLAGCVTVRPWERGQLARRCMTFGARRGEARFDRHVGETREGATGGGGAYGGGCGCN